MAAQHYRYGDYSTRYKFNDKEQDQATGFYYYGARYYAPSLSRWLSTDPLAEKYQGFSAYNYTLNNPINLVDPDGRSVETDFINKSTGEHVYINDGVDQLVMVEDENWEQVKELSIAGEWTEGDTDCYGDLCSSGIVDMNSDLGLLTRLAFAEFEREGVDAKKIAVESVINRMKYVGSELPYNPQFGLSSVKETIEVKGGYAETPTKQQYIDPYGYLNGGGGFGSEYRDKFARQKLGESAFAASQVMSSNYVSTGVQFYVSPPLKSKNIPGYAKGSVKLIDLNIKGISAAGKFIK